MNDSTNASGRMKNWLFNPFIYVAGFKALIIGIVAILAAGYIGSFSNTHFDGVLDAHSGRSAPLWFFLSTGIINWLSMALVFCVVGKIASKKPFRLIDVFGTQAMARWPTLLTALVTLPPGFSRFIHALIHFLRTQKFPDGFNPLDGVVFGLAVLVMLAALCWMVRLMYKGYEVSCNPAQGKAIRSFVVGLILAEIISKVIFIALMKQI